MDQTDEARLGLLFQTGDDAALFEMMMRDEEIDGPARLGLELRSRLALVPQQGCRTQPARQLGRVPDLRG